MVVAKVVFFPEHYILTAQPHTISQGTAMKPQDNREEELRRREQELRERELQLRLRELEAEVHQLPQHSSQQSPLLRPTKHNPPPTKFKTWLKKLTTVGKFLAIVVAVIVAVRVASWLATVIIVAGIAWLAYKILFENDDK